MVSAATGVAAVLLLLLVASGGIGYQELFLLMVVGGVVGAIGVAIVGAGDGRAETLRQWAPFDRETIWAHAIGWYARAGWMLPGSQPGALVFTR